MALHCSVIWDDNSIQVVHISWSLKLWQLWW